MHRRLSVALLLVAGAILLVASCGRNPPPESWTWTAQDSTKIMALVAGWEDSLRSVIVEDTMLAGRVGALPDSARAELYRAKKENKFKKRFFPNSFYRTLTTQVFAESVIVTRDTTVTVRLRETFEGTVLVRAESVTPYIKDSTMGGITYPFHDSVFHPIDTSYTFSYTGSSDRYLYFEPDDKVKRENWHLVRISGGANIASPDEAGAPTNYLLILSTDAGRQDTYYLRPDSLHFGIQRLYRPESLPSYTPDERIRIVMPRAYYDAGYLSDKFVAAFIHLPNDSNPTQSYRRKLWPFPEDTTSFRLTKPGLNQVYFEILPRGDLTEIVPSFQSRIWAIALNIRTP